MWKTEHALYAVSTVLCVCVCENTFVECFALGHSQFSIPRSLYEGVLSIVRNDLLDLNTTKYYKAKKASFDELPLAQRVGTSFCID